MANLVGRPSKYKKTYCKKVIEWGKQGKLPIYWAREIGVGSTTLQRWKDIHEEFADAYRMGMDAQAQYELDLLETNPCTAQLGIAKWKLSAFHHISETNKQEVKQEIEAEVKATITVDFGDRED